MSLGITKIQDILADFCTVDLRRDFTLLFQTEHGSKVMTVGFGCSLSQFLWKKQCAFYHALLGLGFYTKHSHVSHETQRC